MIFNLFHYDCSKHMKNGKSITGLEISKLFDIVSVDLKLPNQKKRIHACYQNFLTASLKNAKVDDVATVFEYGLSKLKTSTPSNSKSDVCIFSLDIKFFYIMKEKILFNFHRSCSCLNAVWRMITVSESGKEYMLITYNLQSMKNLLYLIINMLNVLKYQTAC